MSTTATREAAVRWAAYRQAAAARGVTSGGLDPELYDRYLHPATRLPLDAISAGIEVSL